MMVAIAIPRLADVLSELRRVHRGLTIRLLSLL
jgi:hypothetical protein